MDPNTLEQFGRQLAQWAESAIEESRLPFRKVESAPTLLTEGGKLAPPLVLWINRDSFMAGGVVLLAPRGAEEATEAGCQCARALGLRHFVTWSPGEITFWEDRGPGVVPGKTLPLTDPADAFHQALGRVLEELKYLSVMGAVPPEALTPHYLANLFRGTLSSAHPFMNEAYRIAQGEHRLETETAEAEVLATRKGALTVLRLLALLLFDRLPAAIQPEGLERAMHFALDTLPEAIREALRPERDELPLPAESAVRFHHLFRRLNQLRLGEDPQRVQHTLNILLEHEGPGLGGHPLPGTTEPGRSPLLLVNPDRLPDEAAAELMITGAAPLLGCLALLRHLRNEPLPLAQSTTPLLLAVPQPPQAVRGVLTDQTVPPVRQRQSLSAQLRGSWPTRRFALRPQTPRWAWDFLHLLGLAAEGASLQLGIPGHWLTDDFGEPLFELLREEFSLERLCLAADGTSYLRLAKGPGAAKACVLQGPAGAREIPRQRLAEGPRSLLPLALKLPAPLYSLFEKGQLLLDPELDWPANLEREAFLFSRSSLGRHLWSIISGGLPLPQRPHLEGEARRLGWPLPTREILTCLRQVDWQDAKAPPAVEQLDQELAARLGRDILAAVPPSSNVRRRSRPASRGPADGEDPATEIAAAVFVDGLPQFPEHYLYDYYRPQLHEFSVPGPLSAGEEFFGRYTLSGDTGAILEVEGAETARALVLCSRGQKRTSLSLPADRAVMAEILDRYLDDLRNLRQELVRQVHKRVANPKSAAALVERIWSSQPLPPWSLVSE